MYPLCTTPDLSDILNGAAELSFNYCSNEWKSIAINVEIVLSAFIIIFTAASVVKMIVSTVSERTAEISTTKGYIKED